MSSPPNTPPEPPPKPPIVILAYPQMGENIGASARAMKNCGLTDLRLVAPRDGWPNPSALPIATIGKDILDKARLYDDLITAISDVHVLIATSARPRDMEKPLLTPRETAEMLTTPETQSQTTAFLFGPERSGLDNDTLALADAIAQAPLCSGATSLNLAQAVFLMAWEWRMAHLSSSPAILPETLSPPAPLKARDFFLTRLEQILDAQGFFSSPDLTPIVKRNLRCLLTRAAPTQQELNTLHGILTLCSSSKKAGRK